VTGTDPDRPGADPAGPDQLGDSGQAGRPGLVGWPVNLLVTGRRVVVVGAGRIAARKIESLLELDARVEVVAPEVGEVVGALAAAGRLHTTVREFRPGDLDDAWLAVAATNDAAVNAAVFAASEARRVFCNSADDPSNCSFTLMSVVRQADLVVAVGTGGRSPALATWLKEHVQEEMGPEYATLLDLLSEARESMRATGRSSEDADWRRALGSGIVDLVRAGRMDEAKELLNSCL
jgi:siroheme synthase-like protein